MKQSDRRIYVLMSASESMTAEGRPFEHAWVEGGALCIQVSGGEEWYAPSEWRRAFLSDGQPASGTAVFTAQGLE